MTDPASPQIEIRELNGISELGETERLQFAVWGPDETIDNKDLLLAIQMEGGLVAGAFVPDAGLVGFVFAFPTRDPHVQHSHRLAVLPEWRRHGLGAKMKWFQRDWSLTHGIETIRWTYDPLRSINADLNIRRLGATTRTYIENLYGEMRGINAGTPSDRVMVEWQINSPRVAARAQSAPPSNPVFPEAAEANCPDGPISGEEQLDLDAPQIRVCLPEDFGALLSADRALALAWRLHQRRVLTHYFARGYRVTEVTRSGGPAYILEKR